MELLFKTRIRSQRERIPFFKSSSLWFGKSLLPHWVTSLECYYFNTHVNTNKQCQIHVITKSHFLTIYDQKVYILHSHQLLRRTTFRKRGSYMSALVSLDLLNELGKRYKMRGFFATSLINSIIQAQNVRFYLSYDIKITLKSHFCRKNIII